MGREARDDPSFAVTPNGVRDEMALDEQIYFALSSANNLLTRIYGAALEPLGLTLPRTLVLSVLWDTSPRLVGNIAQALDLDNGSISPMLKRLEARGFVIRVRDKVDERRVHLHITEKGRLIKASIIQVHRKGIEDIGLPAAEMDALKASLKRFSTLLAKRWSPSAPSLPAVAAEGRTGALSRRVIGQDSAS